MNQNIPRQNNGMINNQQRPAIPRPPAGKITSAPNKIPAGQNLGAVRNAQPKISANVPAKYPVPPPIPKPAVKVNSPAAVNKPASTVKTNSHAIPGKQTVPARPSTQIRMQNAKNNNVKRTQPVSRNNPEKDNYGDEPKNKGFFSSKLNIIMSISSIIIIIAVVFMLMSRSDGVSRYLIIVKCTHCNEKFEVDRKEVKGKDFLTCTKCNEIVVLNEEKLKDEAVNLYIKASDLVRQSYKESDSDKAETMREEASVHLEKALEIFRIMPEQQKSATYDNMMTLKKEIRSRRTHH
jgi:hypothetical protein